ncbi:MAG: glutamate mutase L [Anaerolineaceae bacterium]
MPKTYLSLDIGKSQTQAWLFAQRDGTWALQGSFSVPTVIEGDGTEFRKSIQTLLSQIEQSHEVHLLDDRGQITNIRRLEGAPAFIGLTLSAGKPIRTAVIGLSEAYSIAPLRRLVSLFNCEVVLEVNLQDNLNATAQLERLLTSDIELYVIGGGANGGAQKALKAAIENLRLVYHLIPRAVRPQIVYCGNQELAEYAQSEIEAGIDMHLASNIQTNPGEEDSTLVWKAMLKAFERLRLQQIAGLAEVVSDLHTRVIPGDFSAGRMVRFLEQSSENGKGVLMLRVETDTVSVIAARDQKLSGISHRLQVDDAVLETARGLSSQLTDSNSFATYIYNRALFPDYTPATLEDLSIEQAWARARIREALSALQKLDPDFGYNPSLGLMRAYEPIILSESELQRALPHQGLMIALDSILPHGITTILQDEQQLLTALGSLAPIEPLLPVQVMDEEVFTNLATVVTVDTPAAEGQKVLQIEVNEGEQMPRLYHEIQLGDLKRIETLANSKTELYLAPEDESDVGMGIPGLGGWVGVMDSKVGVVIDARGRPLNLPVDEIERADALRNWLWELGG